MEKRTHEWSVVAGGAEAAVRLEDGRLRMEARGSAPGMDFVWDNLGGVSLSGVPRWARLKDIAFREEPDGGRTLQVTVEDEDGEMRLTRSVTVFADHPFIRTWGTVENLGNRARLADGCEMLSIRPRDPLPLALFHVEQFSAQYRRDFFRPDEARLIAGRAPHWIRMGSYPSQHWSPTSCAWFALLADRPGSWFDRPPEPGPGLVCGIEFNGKSTLCAGADERQASIVSTIDELRHPIAPGETFEIPAVFLGRFDGDWDEAGYVTQRFCEAHVCPPMPDDRYPWAQYNSWAYDQDIDEAQQLRAIDRCAELGLELAVLDLGWARMVGDWRPDPVKFPRGLKPLAERARAHGMRFGVHIALAQCNAQAPIAKEHSDWLIHGAVDYFGAAPLCLGHAPCREWLIEQISALIRDEGVDYIIQDGEDMVKRCDREDHTHGPGDSNYANSQCGLDEVIQTLRRRHPSLVIENCEDGGCMMTYKMARLYHTSITVDNIDTYSTRQGVYGASYPFSPRYSVRYMQDAPTRYTLYSSIFGGPLILMHRLTEWTDGQMEQTRRAIALYKRLRVLVRGAKIIHLLPPRNNIPGGGWGWDAIQAVDQGAAQSVVMVYRARGDEGEKRLYPRGLQPDARYRVRLSDEPRGKEARVMTGAELAADGVAVALDEFGAEILFIDLAESALTGGARCAWSKES